MELSSLAAQTGDAIAIYYIPLSDLEQTFLDGNSKRHDTNKIIESIRRYGFKDPIAFDPKLNKGQGGIIEGNGRLEALINMRSQNMKPPRGLKVGDAEVSSANPTDLLDSEWKVPVIFGVNSQSESEAISFSIEHNWSVTWGADINLDRVVSMFDDDALAEQLDFLNQTNSLPISIGDDLDEILQNIDAIEEQSGSEQIDAEEDEILEDWGIIIDLETEAEQVELLERLTAEGLNCKALV